MLRPTARYGIAIMLAVLATTAAWPASRPTRGGPGDVAQVQELGSIHRLLGGSLGWALRLSRALRLVEPAATTSPVYQPWTIIDEPDPAGRSNDERPPVEGRPVPVRPPENPYDDGIDDDSQGAEPLG